MAHIVVVGAGIGGMSAAYELRGVLGNGHRITVVGDGPRFSFNPSNPWLAVGWRKPAEIQVEVGPYLAKKQIDFIPEAAANIDAAGKRLTTVSGRVDIPVHERPPFRRMRGQDSGRCEATVPGHARPAFRVMGGQCGGRLRVGHPRGLLPAGYSHVSSEVAHATDSRTAAVAL